MTDEFSPFPVTGYGGPETFCDREKELSQLKDNLSRGFNTTLFSMRRLGKTGLIHHLFYHVTSARTATIYVDILATGSLREFAGHLATAIFKRFPDNKSAGRKIIEYIRSLHPVISYDALSGQPEITFDTREPRQSEKTIQQLFGFLDQQKTRVVFAIDEFQQILEYPEKNVEAVLRGSIQQLKNTRFIFSGSNQKMMHEIFNSAKRPFFASCSNMHLGHIKTATYQQFISHQFSRYKKQISSEAVTFILDWTLTHTYYTQYMCNHLFAKSQKKITLEDAQKAALDILEQNEPSYFLYRNLLTAAQWHLLGAIAKETRLYKPHAVNFIKMHGLGTSSMVTRGLDALITKEMVLHYTTSEKPYYEVYDKFLMRWLQRM